MSDGIVKQGTGGHSTVQSAGACLFWGTLFMKEILVRERIVHRANMPVNKLHLQAVEQVRASYQSRAYAVIEPLLSEEEQAALKRGRNISSIKPPKNGKMQDYRRATGFGVPVRLSLFAGEN